MGFTPRLSVIIPSYNQRTFAERAVQSVLAQADPLGTEVVVIDGLSRDGTVEHLRSVFADALLSGHLQILETAQRTSDHALLINEGVSKAGGSVLAFLNAKDWWRPGRIQALEPLLKRHDLILASSDPMLSASSDWVRSLVTANPVVPSSGVIRRTLFEEVGGLIEGSAGLREEEYAFWLRCLHRLQETSRRDRVLLIPNQHVVNEEALFPGVQLAAGILPKLQSLREGAALVSVARRLPARYWGGIAKRLAEVGQSLFKRPRGR